MCGFARVETEDQCDFLASLPPHSQVKERLSMASSSHSRVVVEVNVLAFDRTHSRRNQCKSGQVVLKERPVEVGVVQIPVSLYGRARP